MYKRQQQYQTLFLRMKEHVIELKPFLEEQGCKKKNGTLLYFQLGLQTRLLQSALRDADCYDTYLFMNHPTLSYNVLQPPYFEKNRLHIWETLEEKLNAHLLTLQQGNKQTEINQLRNCLLYTSYKCIISSSLRFLRISNTIGMHMNPVSYTHLIPATITMIPAIIIAKRSHRM